MMRNERIYVDLHVLQTVPPSCVNRDDTGSPKTAVYGGVTRARVSSQSWKRAIRLMFKDSLPNDKLGARTKRIVEMVAEEIVAYNTGIDAEDAATKILIAAGLKIKSVEKGTDALFFLSVAQARALAKLVVEEPDIVGKSPSKEQKKKAANALKSYPGIDVALFGRMVADDPSLNTDACAQVAHSISTHKVNNEYDYFTAVDDRAPENNAGAAHIDTAEYNSSTLYRYATVAVHELYRQLGDDTQIALAEFIRAFICAMPTGKQNTYANRTLPDAVLVTIRNDQPINLVGAFEKPIYAGDDGYVLSSAKRLVNHSDSVYRNFAGKPLASFVTGDLFGDFGTVQPLNDMLENLSTEVEQCLLNGDEQ